MNFNKINTLQLVSIGAGIGLVASIYHYVNEKGPLEDEAVPNKLRTDFKTLTMNFDGTEMQFDRNQMTESMLLDLVRQADPKIQLYYTRDSCGSYVCFYHHFPTSIFMPTVDLFPRDKLLAKFPKLENHINIDSQAVLAHEIGHAVDPNFRRTYLACDFAIRPLAGALGVLSLYHPALAIIGATVCTSMYLIYLRQAEVKADLYACQVVGGERMARMFEANMQQKLAIRPSLPIWRRAFVTSSGNLLLDLNHPLLSTRVQYCRQYELTRKI